MRRRAAGVLAAATMLWFAAACLDIASPVTGISSITPVLLATPSVVLGNPMRDTAGVVQRLKVIVFGPNGDTVRDASIRFFTDQPDSLQVDSAGDVLGLRLSTSAHVFADVRPASGSGVIETLPVSLPVVPMPDSARKDTNFTWTPKAATADTLSSTLISPAINVTVKAANGTPVQSFPVIFNVTSLPKSIGPNDTVTVVLTNSAGHDTTVAITNSAGVASIYLRLRPSVSNLQPDSVHVTYKVRYPTAAIEDSTGTYVIQIRPTFTP